MDGAVPWDDGWPPGWKVVLRPYKIDATVMELVPGWAYTVVSSIVGREKAGRHGRDQRKDKFAEMVLRWCACAPNAMKMMDRANSSMGAYRLAENIEAASMAITCMFEETRNEDKPFRDWKRRERSYRAGA